ncbi:hypothetical protein [Ralstonia chuxiongensis]|nr:hypothetical protein [Ralstonia chuxiongensis]
MGAELIGSHTMSLKSSHMSLVSHPVAVADFIERAAKQAQR